MKHQPNHPLQQYFNGIGIRHKINKETGNPEADHPCKALMEHTMKIWHNATAKKKSPALELNKYLRTFRATPQPNTGASPRELFQSQKYKGFKNQKAPKAHSTHKGVNIKITKTMTKRPKTNKKAKKQARNDHKAKYQGAHN